MESNNKNIIRRIKQKIRNHPRIYKLARKYLDFLKLRKIKKSGFFDPVWYQDTYPDVAQSIFPPDIHFLRFGAREGRNPGPDFYTNTYYRRYPELRLLDINPLVHYYDSRNKEVEFKSIFTIPNFNFPTDKKIAVIIHAYYLDLLPGLLEKANNIPVVYDLFVSVVSENDKSNAEELVGKLSLARSFEIKIVPNRGRDISPLVLAWHEKIKSYDFICKIHTKKSLYTGKEKQSWRDDLLEGILGTKEIVKYILDRFIKEPDIGVVYSDSMFHIPYWGYTALSNKDSLNRLQKLIGIRFDTDHYMDFPAGSMFWFKQDALKQLLNGKISLNDFSKEEGQIDGTLSHAIERAINYIAKNNGYTFLEINVKQQILSKGRNHRNLYQYDGRKIEHLLDEIDTNDIISFDIFDTLLTRPLISPNEVFDIVDEKLENEFNCKVNFKEERKKAENIARGMLKKDVNYFEIYDAMQNYSQLSPELSRRAKVLEYETELELLEPRYDVLKTFEYALEKGKRIIIVSDMYFTREQIEKLLRNNGISGYQEIYLSSEVNKRKDSGSMWPFVIEKEGLNERKFIHIGDNEHSDIQMTGIHGLRHYHTMSPVNLFVNSTLGARFIEKYDWKWKNLKFLGPYIKTSFNSPFMTFTAMPGCPRETGYNVFGPILFSFLKWLDEKSIKDGIEKLYFFSREGYVLKELFDYYLKLKNPIEKDKRETIYLLISRRAILGTLDKNREKLREILLLSYFNGFLSELLEARFGYRMQNRRNDKRIELPRDIEIVLDAIVPELDSLNANAQKERDAYLQYLQTIGFNSGGKAGVVDIGYSATSQRYLHEITDVPLVGYYFATRLETKTWGSDKNHVNGFFATLIEKNDRTPVYLYSLIFESWMLSQNGQFNRMMKSGASILPEYSENKITNEKNRVINEIVKGIKQFIKEMLVSFPEEITINPLDAQLPLLNAVENDVWDSDTRKLLFVEDNYCGNNELDVLSLVRGL